MASGSATMPECHQIGRDWSVGEAGRGSTDGAAARESSLPRNCASAVAAVDTIAVMTPAMRTTERMVHLYFPARASARMTLVA